MLPDSQNTDTGYTDPRAREPRLRHGAAGAIVPGRHLSLASPTLTHSPLHASCAGHTLATSCPPVPLSFSDETVG